MKLAELLVRKGIVKKQLTELESMLSSNACVPEESVAECEEIEPLFASIDAKYEELHKIGVAVSKYNREFETSKPGETIDQALVRRDVLIKRLTKLREIYRSVKTQRGYSRDDGKYVVLVSPLRMRGLIDQFQTELNELETRVQMANWKHDIPECV